MYSSGPVRIDEQRKDDQLESTYNSFVSMQDVALRTCRKQWTREKGGEKGSRISVLVARHDDDDVKQGDIEYIFWVVGMTRPEIEPRSPEPLANPLSKTFLFQAAQFIKTVLFRTILFSISIVFVYTQLNVKTVLVKNNSVYRKNSFNVKNCSISINSVEHKYTFFSIWPIHRTLLGTITPGQSGSGNDWNEGVLCIP